MDRGLKAKSWYRWCNLVPVVSVCCQYLFLFDIPFDKKEYCWYFNSIFGMWCHWVYYEPFWHTFPNVDGFCINSHAFFPYRLFITLLFSSVVWLAFKERYHAYNCLSTIVGLCFFV